MQGGWIVLLAMALAVLGVIVARALGRLAFARSVHLPIERAWLRIFVRLGERHRTGAHLGVLATGLVAAYGAVVALAFVLYLAHGVPTGESSLVVDEVLAGHPAEGKLQRGDRLLALDGAPLLPGGPALAALVEGKQGAPVTLTVRRAGALLDVPLQPARVDDAGRPTWRLGVRQRREPIHATGPLAAAEAALAQPPALAAAFVSELVSALADDAADVGGPVRIVEEFQRAVDPVAVVAGRSAVNAAAVTLLVLLLLDLARLAARALAWLRRLRE